MEVQILDGVQYTIKRKSVKIGDKIFDKNGPTVYVADISDADEYLWVVVSEVKVD